MVVNTTSRTWRAVVNTSCGENKTFPGRVGHRVLTCADNGKWRPDSVDCIDIVAPPKYTPVVQEAPKADVIGAVVLTLLAAVVGLVIVSDIPALVVAFRRFRDVIANR
ncbi:hypothetical protein LSAT2_000809 [Lamellibrachia satsuma]|nr:hypothetical protein LSAT2_000809 [Lamellibrachia satsuma]